MLIIIYTLLLIIVSANLATADWHFESFGGEVTVTDLGADNSPSLSNENPSNDSSGTSLNPELSVDCSNDDGSNFDLYIWTNASGSWATLESFLNVGNNTGAFFDADTSNMNEFTTTYYWSVNATDNHGGSGNWTNETYHFTTGGQMTFDYVIPVNESTGVALTPTLQVMPVPPPAKTNVDLYFRTNASGSWLTIRSHENVAPDINRTTQGTDTSNMNQYNTKYYWSANCTPTSESNWTNITYHFTTLTESQANTTWHSSSFGGSVTVNEPSNIGFTSVSPSNGATDQDFNPELSAQINNSIGNNMNVYFCTNASGSWAQITQHLGVGNGSRPATPTNMNANGTTYYWSINATDTVTSEWHNETFHFTTSYNNSITFNYIVPADDATGINLRPTLQVYPLSQGSNINLYFFTNVSGGWNVITSHENVPPNQNWTSTATSDMNTMLTKYWWSVNATVVDSGEWYNTTYSFTTKEANITWHSSNFGGSVTVTSPSEPGITWHSSSFGGSVTVNAPPSWGNWSAYWRIGQTSTSDLDLDMDVDSADVTILESFYGSTGSYGWIYADINNDGKVNYVDAAILALLFGDDYT